MTDRDDETIRSIIRDVYAAGALPPARAVAHRWRTAGAHPGRLLGASALTIGACPVILLYVTLATVVPLTVGFLLTITSPIIVVSMIQRSIDVSRSSA